MCVPTFVAANPKTMNACLEPSTQTSLGHTSAKWHRNLR